VAGRDRKGGKPPTGKGRGGKPPAKAKGDGRQRRGPSRSDLPQRPGFPDQLEGRNLVLAGLRVSRRVRAIWLDERAGGNKIDAILAEAGEAGVPVTPVPRAALDAVAQGHVHNGVIGFADGLPQRSLKQVLDDVFDGGEVPFFVLLDQVQYEQNLGAILRTAAAAGVHGIIIPTRRGASLSPTAQRIAMGGAEEVPVVRESMMSALATLRRAGITIVGTEAGSAVSFTEANLTGPLALVMGGEDRGLSPAVAQRCDSVVHIPMKESLAVTSLNVSVSTALLLYERVRQVAALD